MRPRFLLLIVAIFLGGCGLVDSGIEWRGGPYALTWIDDPSRVYLARDEGGGGWTTRVTEQVFAVGWDGRYLVAKQHPKGDRKVVRYFIVDSKKDSAHASPESSVIGPLEEGEFKRQSDARTLPQFTKILASLE
jgi:hypothetical protein